MSQTLIVATIFCLGIQVYHYAGYPLFLLALRTVLRRPVRKGPATPRVSLIIAAHNEAGTIEAKLRNSLALDYPALEIVVVSDGSDDDTNAIVARYMGRGVIGVFLQERQGKATALNAGAAAATGEILLVCDANAFYAKDAVTRLVENFADPEVGCVGGRRTVRAINVDGTPSPLGRSDSIYWRYESMISRWESEISSTVSMTGKMLAIRRQVFTPIPPTVINDDSFLVLHVLRLGWRAVYEPTAVCWEFPSVAMNDEITRRRRVSAGRYQLLMRLSNWPWWRPLALFNLLSHKFLRLLLPLFMVCALAANLALLAYPPVPPAMLLLLAGQVGFYGLAAIGLLAERAGRKWMLPYLAYYLTEMNFSSLRGLAGYLLGTQGVIWRKARRQHVQHGGLGTPDNL